MGWREPSLYPSAAHPHSTLAAVGAGSGGGGLWFAPLTCWGGVRRWQRWGYIHRAVLAGTVGASLAVLRGRGSLSMFLLLLLHLLYDFPDLALCSLGGRGEQEPGIRVGTASSLSSCSPPAATASHRSAPSKLLITGQAGSLAQP